MNAKEYRIELTVPVELVLMDDASLEAHIGDIRARIREQLAGHRTEKRLVDTVGYISVRIVSESSRRI